MKKLGLLLLLMAINFMVRAQSAEEREVSAAVEKMRLAMISGNKAVLEDIAATALSYGHSSGKLEDKAAFIESIVSAKSDFVSIALSNQTIKISGQTALVRHQLDAKTNDSGVAGEVHLGIFLVWQKQGKEWKLLGRQAYKLP